MNADRGKMEDRELESHRVTNIEVTGGTMEFARYPSGDITTIDVTGGRITFLKPRRPWYARLWRWVRGKP